MATCGDPAIQGLPYATRARIGGTMEVLGRSFRFLDPPLADRSHTSWVYDESSRVMFVADGFGSYHAAGTDGVGRHATTKTGLRRPTFTTSTATTSFGSGMPTPPLVMEALERLFEENPVSWVAPIHGPPIAEAGSGRLPGQAPDGRGQLERGPPGTGLITI